MVLNLYQVDAFAEEIFHGNPAAVIPLEHWLDDELMQKIAMENNLSETAFFVKTCPHQTSPDRGGTTNTQSQLPEDKNHIKSLYDDRFSELTAAQEKIRSRDFPPLGEQKGAAYHLRWFTPDYEIDLCGHATLASAYVIKNFIEPHLLEINFTTQKAGVLKAFVKDGNYTLDFPSRIPVACDVAEKLFESLGITKAVEILRSRDYFVVLENEDAVTNVEPDFNLMKQLETIGVIITAKGQAADVVSRCFYPSAGISEDPVTGSAHCTIVPYWSKKLGTNKLQCKQLSKRGGKLDCKMKGDRVLMSGKCVLYMKGEIFIS